MDDSHFDRLARSVGRVSTRRRLVSIVAIGLANSAMTVGNPSATLAYRKCRLPGGRRGRRCHGECVDVKNDEHNCGGCGRFCADGAFCCNGWCADPAENAPGCCPPSLSCGGVCTSPYGDRANCGGCGIACGDDEDCCDGRCLARGTDQKCESCSTCPWGGDWFCNPTLYGDGMPGCDCQGDNCPLG